MFLSSDCSYIFGRMQCYWWSVVLHPRLQVSCNCWLLGRLLSILPVQVEEMKRRQYTLAFTSAGAPAQTYHISFETLAECQRWHRQASTVRPWGRCGLDGGAGYTTGRLLWCKLDLQSEMMLRCWRKYPGHFPALFPSCSGLQRFFS